jgi:hypothetical protein
MAAIEYGTDYWRVILDHNNANGQPLDPEVIHLRGRNENSRWNADLHECRPAPGGNGNRFRIGAGRMEHGLRRELEG